MRRQWGARYILDADHNPVLVDDLLEWARGFEIGKRRVDFTELGGGVSVSTVFLGIDHNYRDEGPPVLFETMVFGPEDMSGLEVPENQLVDIGDVIKGNVVPLQWLSTMQRYCTWDEAKRGHDATVRAMRGYLARKAGANGK